MTSAPFIDVKNLRRVFDVSKPWLNRMLEGGHLEFLKAVDGVTFDIEPGAAISVDWQRIANPAYNAARGPVQVVAVRLHVQY